MTIPLSQVRDPDCVASLSPLTFDSGTAYVTGAVAILRRCLYAICTPRGALVWSEDSKGRGVDVRDLQNATLDVRGIAGWKRAIERQLRAVDYVVDAAAGLALYKGTWIVMATVVLEDGGTYPLEVSIADAGAALASLGAS